MRYFVLLFLCVVLPTSAQAKWLVASSNHFVIYSDDNDKNLTKFAEQLERFHGAMTGLLGVVDAKPSPSNRVTIYVVSSAQQVRKLAGDDVSRFTYGVYRPQAGGSLAFVPDIRAAGSNNLDFSMIVLLHEYAHHVTLSASNDALPVWVVEGSAEFFASAQFHDDGSVGLGRPAHHRGGELFFAQDVPLKDLFAPDVQRREKQKNYDSFYGKSWLLFHYLTFNEERKGQMKAYLKAFNQGVDSIEAAKAAFGDFDTLEKELDKYLKARTMTMVRMSGASLAPGPVEIRELTAGEAAMMPVRMRSKRGVNREQALDLLPDAQKVAADYPDDPAVLSALAEAEFDAGNPDAAIAAADKALAIDPSQVNAYLQKGYALLSKASDVDDEDQRAAAYTAARKPFLDLNQLENDHPLPLEYFYLSYLRQGKKPPKMAVSALRRAVELAPFDLNLRMILAVQDMRDDDRAEAIFCLKPIAFNPHGGAFAEQARKILERLQTGEPTQNFFRNGNFQPSEGGETDETSEDG